MNSESLKPNIPDLQRDVIDLLEKVSDLMGRASTALSSDSAGKKYAEFEREVAKAADNVRELALRMAIVAPMKAGKSTIINAIIGQDLLPSRNAAMTTLPTEIVFQTDLQKPILTLNPEILAVFQRTLEALKHKISKLGLDNARNKVKRAQYPHLVKLVEKISTGASVPAKTEGRDKIVGNLSGLNDMIRLCSVLDPLADPLESPLVDVPRINTPFWRSQATEQSNWLGNLVIIDTPGPNEAGENLRLKSVVSEQLQKSSIVLIVLDFTQLKTEAAEKVKKEVQQVVRLRGSENLYVLINKVDQRREGDMTSEQVREFVSSELGLDDEDRVFEVAARWAFSAASFMLELQQHPERSIQEMQTARSLAQETLGARWETKLNKANVEDLQSEANYLWEESGFPPFLEKAIDALMERAAPKSMQSALNIARSYLVQLHDDVKLRSSAIAQDEEKLRREVGALEADLHRIEVSRQKLVEVHKIKEHLYRELNGILDNLKKDANISLETFFSKEEYEQAGLLKKGELFFRNLGASLTLQKKYAGTGTIEFKSHGEAEKFATQAVSLPKQRAERLLESVRQQVGDIIERSRQDLMKELQQETQPIIEKARQRLNENFNLDLSLPQPKLNSVDMDVKPRVTSDYKMIDQGYETKVEKKRSFWRWFWLVPYEETTQVKRPDKREDYYTVSLTEIVDQVNQWIEQSIQTIKRGISEYLEEDFQQQVNVFFGDLDRYLSNYRDSLRQAQEDQKLSLEQKGKLIGEFDYINSEAEEKIKKAETYIQHTDSLIPGK